MASVEELKGIVDESLRALGADPSAGRGTATTVVRVRDGVTCDIEDGPWKLIADEMPGDGGSGLGPDPGVLARAALGSCLAMGYVMWAAHLGVPLESLAVTVEGDYDAAAMMGLANDRPPGFSEVRYVVRIESPAGEAEVQRLVEEADRLSSLLDVFRRAVSVKRRLIVSSPLRGS